MSNRLEYNGVTFDDSMIINGTVTENKSPLTDVLSYDSLDVDVLNYCPNEYFLTSEAEQFVTADGETLVTGESQPIDLRVFTRGSAGQMYHDELFLGKYYIDSVDRKSKNVYTLHFISALGLLDTKVFKGGLYTRATAGSIINAIMGGTYQSQDDENEYYTGQIPYAIQKTLKAVEVTGWIPYTESSRTALQQLLFAIGGSVLKTSNGTMRFAFWQPTEAERIADERLYVGGSTNYPSKATHVMVTEHEFRQTSLDKQVELFNSQGITVTNKLILFDKPCHTLAGSGLTISESGSNYAVVSGVGTLTGYEYTHNTVIVEKNTGVSGDDSTTSVTEAYLVSSLNSLNLVERLSAYYGYADMVNYDVVQNGDLKVGDRVKFTDPFGDEVTGYIASQELTLSNTLKGAMEFVTNWLPNHTGNQYNHYTILSSGTSWSVPSALQGTPARVVIFSGFEGGGGGSNGENGQEGYWALEDDGRGGQGGAGGAGGTGGTTCKIATIDIQSLASSYSLTIGQGGAGGQAGQAGSLGSESIFNGVSSESGVTNTIGWANPIDGTIYGGKADDGIAGSAGGTGGRAYWDAFRNVTYATDGTAGQDNGTRTGGAGGLGYQSGRLNSGGGGGGGASAISNGANGTNGIDYYGGNGGNGGSASVVVPQAQLGQCGKGSNGGGGGGGSAICLWFNLSRSTYIHYYAGTIGQGGAGCQGQQGSNGFILVMHN